MTAAAERRAEAKAELLRGLAAKTASLADTEEWKSYLATAAKFHRYSPNNVTLIAMQRPDATRVAGFQTWKSMGRAVRKGEKGIAILAPMTYKRRDEESDEDIYGVRGFKVVYVFDVSQTDGPDLPELSVPEVGEVGDETLFARLLMVAEAEGVSVSDVDDLGGARGDYCRATKAIRLVTGFSEASRTRTLLHELAHHFDLSDGEFWTPRATRELVAESAAYVVATEVGLDTAEYSTFYVASWAGGDAERIEALAGQVLKVVKALSAAVEAAPVPVLMAA